MLTDVTPLWTSFMFHFFLSLPGNKVPSFTNHHPGERSKSREKGKLAPDGLGGAAHPCKPNTLYPAAQPLLIRARKLGTIRKGGLISLGWTSAA